MALLKFPDNHVPRYSDFNIDSIWTKPSEAGFFMSRQCKEIHLCF